MISKSSMFAFLCIYPLVITAADVSFIDLTTFQWEFRSTNNQTWYNASVPSTFHMDLLDNNLMPDPYYRDNLLQYYALEYDDWEYRTTFNVDKTTLAKQVVELVFEGLDTHTNITLNSKTLGTTNNAHRTWVFDAKNMLQEGSNSIVILFASAAKHDQDASDAQIKATGIDLPANYSYSRKAAYQYGWDWGPRLVSAGIWKPIKVRAFDKVQIASVLFRNQKITSASQYSAQMYGSAVLRTATPGSYIIQILDNNTQQVLFNDSLVVSGGLVEQQFRRLYIDTEVKELNKTFSFNLNNIKIWWTWNLGTPNLYTFKVNILDSSMNILDTYTTRYGIRTVQWVQQSDVDGKGQSFRLELNSVPIFMKGSNYIPPDMFMPRALKNPDVYYKTVQAAVDGNQNMLRLWGGGQYEFDIFYDICDEKGILIWHDMMFACALYPGEQDMLDNIAAETRDNVRRLSNHPSIAMWNGNNEVYIGWKEWGWKNAFNSTQQDTVWSWYQKIFDQTIPNVLAIEDPDRFYWPTSPTSSQWANFSQGGDIHQWIVWASQGDIEIYNSHVGRFVSEYGMQGMIPMSSIKQFTKEEDRDYNTTVMLIHERHIAGWPNLFHYMDKYFKPAKDFESFVYGTMIMQAYAFRTGIEAMRRNKPYCMGSLYWQINDVWPVFSWATIDFYGQWKAGHYRAKHAYEDIALYITSDSNSTQAYEIYLLNDKMTQVQGSMVIDILQYTGEKLSTQTYYYVSIPANGRQVYNVEFHSSPKFNLSNAYARVTLRDYNTQAFIYQNIFHYTTPVNFNLPKPDIQVSFDTKNNTISFWTSNFAYYVYAYVEDDITFKLDQNFFDLTPGYVTVAKILSNHTATMFQSNDIPLMVRSYWDTYN